MTTNENQRIQNENTRITNETNRVSAENKRQTDTADAIKKPMPQLIKLMILSLKPMVL